MRFWLGGSLISLTGVVLARVVAPAINGNTILTMAVYILGVTLGLAGLVFITFGMEKRLSEGRSRAGGDYIKND